VSRPSAYDWTDLLKEYESTGKTLKVFAAEKGIERSHLTRELNKERDSQEMDFLKRSKHKLAKNTPGNLDRLQSFIEDEGTDPKLRLKALEVWMQLAMKVPSLTIIGEQKNLNIGPSFFAESIRGEALKMLEGKGD